MEFLTPTTPSKLIKTTTRITTPLRPSVSSISSSFSSSSLACRTPEPSSSILSPTTKNNSEISKSSCKKSSQKSDRFIPNRSKMDYSYCNYSLFSDVGKNENEDEAKTMTTTPNGNKLNEDIFQLANHTPGKRLLSCFDNCDDNDDNNNDSNTSIPNKREYTPRKSSKKIIRTIPTAPSKILDAPNLMDDYYLNLMSWGSNNVIAIALSNSVYLWHASDGQIELLVSLDESEYVSSVSFCGSKDPNCLAIGTSSNEIQLWDTSRLTKIRDLTGHTARVSSLSWNNSILSSGGRDSMILNHDIRSQRSLQSTYLGHQQEVCGLSWSPDGQSLASGGNDNILCLWDAAMSSSSSWNSPNRRLGMQSSNPRHKIEAHTAAVKALAWCPFQRNLLASGGGTADRTIRMWNSQTGDNLCTLDTGSQVCAMQWSESHRELVSSHGFSDNQLCLWKYSHGDTNLTKLKELRGHTSRVLHMAKSPDGTQIVTAGADESLRFWDLFPSYSGLSKGKGSSSSSCSPHSGFNAGVSLLSSGPSLR